MGNTSIGNIAGLGGLPSLLELTAPNTNLTSISGIENALDLLRLDVSFTFVTQLPDLTLWPNLDRLVISGLNLTNPILDLSANTLLVRLFAVDCGLSEIVGLSGLSQLVVFVVNSNNLTSIAGLEDAMPLLRSAYLRIPESQNPIIYESRQKWSTREKAALRHQQNCLKLINYGGHQAFGSSLGQAACSYRWSGLSRYPLMPTLTSLMLFSFSLASIVRYRPALLDTALSSPTRLLFDTFVQEADATFIPALRNLLYRDEMYIGPVSFI